MNRSIDSLIEKETEMFIERYIHLMLIHGFTIDVVRDKLHQMVINELLKVIRESQDSTFKRLIARMDDNSPMVDIPDSIHSPDEFVEWIRTR
jgi:hypothetical protein